MLLAGVVVMCEDAPRGSALLFLRGAPAVIRSLVNPATIPDDFDNVCITAGCMYTQYALTTSGRCAMIVVWLCVWICNGVCVIAVLQTCMMFRNA